MRWREFIANVGATAILPSIALAQTKVWRLGMLDTASRELNSRNLEAFQMRLRELGYVEGSNLVVNYRSSDGRYEGLPTLVTELLRLKPRCHRGPGDGRNHCGQERNNHDSNRDVRCCRPSQSGRRGLIIAPRRQYHRHGFGLCRTRDQASSILEGDRAWDHAYGMGVGFPESK